MTVLCALYDGTDSYIQAIDRMTFWEFMGSAALGSAFCLVIGYLLIRFDLV